MTDFDPSRLPSADTLTVLHERLLKAVAYRLGDPEAAEDAAQESMLILVRKWPQILARVLEQHPRDAEAITSQLVAYLATAGARKHLESAARVRPTPVPDELLRDLDTVGPDQGATLDLAALRSELIARLDAFRAALSPVEQQVFDAALQGRPWAEVAAELDKSPNALYQVQKRLRARLTRDEQLAALCASLRVARAGHYGADDDLAPIATTLALPTGTTAGHVFSTGMRWHRDGHLRGVLLCTDATLMLPSVTLGLALLSPRAQPLQCTPTTPFALAWHASPTGRTAQLDAFLGAPADSDLSGDGCEVPAEGVALALAG